MRYNNLTLLLIHTVIYQVTCLGIFHPAIYLENHLVIRQFGISFTNCKTECEARSLCDSVNFNQKKSFCELVAGPQTFQPDHLIRKPGWVYSRRENWTQSSTQICGCTQEQKCNFNVNNECTMAECQPPDDTEDMYRFYGNIHTVGGKIVRACTRYVRALDGPRQHVTLTCGQNGSWESSMETQSCGRIMLHSFKGSDNGLKYHWLAHETNRDISCLRFPDPDICLHPYRHGDIDHWSELNVLLVLFSIVKNNKQVHYVLFNGTGSTKDSWFAKERVLDTSWSDLIEESNVEYFSVLGVSGNSAGCFKRRRFLIGKTSGGCDTDSGWFAALKGNEGKTMCCQYDFGLPLKHLYAKGNNVGLFNNPDDVDYADYVDIIVFTEDGTRVNT